MYQKPMRPDELYHFGVKGMHWGVRRYQNPDGSLTAAGKKHYEMGEKRKAAVDTGLSRTIKTGKGKENQSPVEQITREVNKSVNDSADIVRTASKIHNENEEHTYNSKMNKKISKMSDEELQHAIKRLDMEKRYKDLNRKQVRDGYDKAMDILTITGKVTSIAASTAAVATTIYKLKKG